MSTNTPIATQTLGSAAASVTFSSIPQGYTDLILVIAGTVVVVDHSVGLQFNSDTGVNYSSTFINGNGSTATSSRVTADGFAYAGSMDAAQSNSIISIQNYSNTTTYKTILGRGNVAAYRTRAYVGVWRNTNAITSITVLLNGTSFATGCTFSIYGIQAGNKDQKATGGNIVTTDGTYMYHTFNSSGYFIPNQAITVDYLVVAGGGGAGGGHGGGGGAGGMRSTVTATGGGGSLESPLSLIAQPYAVTIGAGGALGRWYGIPGQHNDGQGGAGLSGSNSVFSTITSTGGGGGGGYANNTGSLNNGKAGGSGGGGVGQRASSAGTRTASPVQGFDGGSSTSSAGAGGGGGAGAVGVSSTGNGGGNGGVGIATSITGSSVTYAGGGGGGTGVGSVAGTGGAGGGGNGSSSAEGVGVSGTVNTGGGAGGGGGTYNISGPYGGTGGSGVVVIRYLA